MYNLSVVNIVEDQYKDVINAIAEAYGCGPNNLSVKLQDVNGAIYWGCHSCEFIFNVEPPADIPNASEALAALYERVGPDGDANANWQAALAEKGLVQV